MGLLDLIVPDVETKIETKKTFSEKEQDEKVARDEVEKAMFNQSNDVGELEGLDEDLQTSLKSQDTEGQINKDTIRSLYVTEESAFRAPCVVLDFSNVKSMREYILNQIKIVVKSDTFISKNYTGKEYEDVLNELETTVYTMTKNKTVRLGRINKNKSLRLLIQLMMQAGIGELNKDFKVLYSVDGNEFKAKDLKSSNDFINI